MDHILITGATGGIGQAVVRSLAEQEAKLCLSGRNEAKLQELISSLPGEGHYVLPLHLENPESLEGPLKNAVKAHGRFTGFVHAAGVGDVRPIRLTKTDFVNRVMKINFSSYLEIVRVLSSKQCKGDYLNIVGVSAIGALIGNSTKTAYCASKAAMNAATRCLAKELAPKNIRINTVAPGATQSDMLSDILNLPGGDVALAKITERQFLGVCSPYDIAQGILFLLNLSSKMITGHCLPIDGGKLIN